MNTMINVKSMKLPRGRKIGKDNKRHTNLSLLMIKDQFKVFKACFSIFTYTCSSSNIKVQRSTHFIKLIV